MSIFAVYMQTSIFNLATHLSELPLKISYHINPTYTKVNVSGKSVLWQNFDNQNCYDLMWYANEFGKQVLCFHCIAFSNHNQNYRVLLCIDIQKLCAHYQQFLWCHHQFKVWLSFPCVTNFPLRPVSEYGVGRFHRGSVIKSTFFFPWFIPRCMQNETQFGCPYELKFVYDMHMNLVVLLLNEEVKHFSTLLSLFIIKAAHYT